jgi:hypothetical protein
MRATVGAREVGFEEGVVGPSRRIDGSRGERGAMSAAPPCAR